MPSTPELVEVVIRDAVDAGETPDASLVRKHERFLRWSAWARAREARTGSGQVSKYTERFDVLAVQVWL